jgi:hypothetical protein
MSRVKLAPGFMDEARSPLSSAGGFSENEKVLAHHQGMMYEAKVCVSPF